MAKEKSNLSKKEEMSLSNIVAGTLISGTIYHSFFASQYGESFLEGLTSYEACRNSLLCAATFALCMFAGNYYTRLQNRK